MIYLKYVRELRFRYWKFYLEYCFFTEACLDPSPQTHMEILVSGTKSFNFVSGSTSEMPFFLISQEFLIFIKSKLSMKKL